MTFLRNKKVSSSRRGSFFALSAAGLARDTPVHHGASRPGSVARALGVQSRELWQVTTGSLSDQLEPTRRMQTPTHFVLFLFYSLFTSLLLFLNYHSSRERLGSHGTTAELHAFPFVTATNGAYACGFVNVRVVCAFHCRILPGTAVGTRTVSRT